MESPLYVELNSSCVVLIQQDASICSGNLVCLEACFVGEELWRFVLERLCLVEH
jgi:hypothetical protein